MFFFSKIRIFSISLLKKKFDNNLIYGSDSGSERMTYSGEASLCSQYRHIFARVAGLGESLPGLLSTLLHQHSTVLTLYKLVEVKFLVYLCYKIWTSNNLKLKIAWIKKILKFWKSIFFHTLRSFAWFHQNWLTNPKTKIPLKSEPNQFWFFWRRTNLERITYTFTENQISGNPLFYCNCIDYGNIRF